MGLGACTEEAAPSAQIDNCCCASQPSPKRRARCYATEPFVQNRRRTTRGGYAASPMNPNAKPLHSSWGAGYGGCSGKLGTKCLRPRRHELRAQSHFAWQTSLLRAARIQPTMRPNTLRVVLDSPVVRMLRAIREEKSRAAGSRLITCDMPSRHSRDRVECLLPQVGDGASCSGTPGCLQEASPQLPQA